MGATLAGSVVRRLSGSGRCVCVCVGVVWRSLVVVMVLFQAAKLERESPSSDFVSTTGPPTRPLAGDIRWTPFSVTGPHRHCIHEYNRDRTAEGEYSSF